MNGRIPCRTLILAVLFASTCSLLSKAHAAFGFVATDGAFISITSLAGTESFRLTPSTGGEDPFDNYNFNLDNTIPTLGFNYGTNPLILSGLTVQTVEDNLPDNVTSVSLFFRQYELGATPGAFDEYELDFLSDLGGGIEEYGLAQSINLPASSGVNGPTVIELYLEAETELGATTVLGGRDGTNPYAAYYTSWGIPEPSTFGMLLIGLLGIRYVHRRRTLQQKRLGL